MDDSELSRYIPAFGDRVNLRSLSKPDTGRKAALFDKLRSKMKLQTKGNCDESGACSSRLPGVLIYEGTKMHRN